MFRMGGNAGRRPRLSRSQLLLGVPVVFGAAAFVSALSSDPDARLATTSSVADVPVAAAPAPVVDPASAPATPVATGADVTAVPTPTESTTPAATQAATPTAAPAGAKPDTTLPANPALRSLEARMEYSRQQTAAALEQLAAATGLQGVPADGQAGHGGGTNPELLPDLRPLARPAADEPGGDPILTPDPTGPVWDNFVGPFREKAPGEDVSNLPEPNYTAEERNQLAAEGKELFFSTTAWGQKPSEGPLVAGEFLSCATCHSGEGFTDGRTHLVGPVREREFGHRQTPELFGTAHTNPFGWDGRNPQLQNQARGAIVSPLEMHASQEPTKRELDALAEFQRRIVEPKAVPGRDFDPVKAARGEKLFKTPRNNVDPSGEFAAGEKIACATCHAGEFFTDGKAHRIALPTFFTGDALFDPGEIDNQGNIRGFNTPSLLGVRFGAPFFHDGIAGDPTAPSNLLGGGLGVGALDGDIGASGPAAARRALMNNVLPFYNSIRFNFGFTQDELADLAEFLLSI
jgi:cytochrome c peroxidase